MEVMKNGQIIEKREVAEKAHYTFGRSPGCDFLLEHPSASRLHAVVQYRAADKRAFLYDAGSAHGTFLNKRQIKARTHEPLRCASSGAVGLKRAPFKRALSNCCAAGWKQNDSPIMGLGFPQ
jgi:pSer/pThr/pTyr-binding forkhead associated (FHA) protein